MVNMEGSLARGGGNATAAGIAFQASIASYFGAILLSERPAERLPELDRAIPISVRVETEAPVDDILIETAIGGFLFIQAKASLQWANKADSPLGKTVDQFVRQWIVCATGSGGRGWDRPLSLIRDRLLLAVGPETSKAIGTTLRGR